MISISSKLIKSISYFKKINYNFRFLRTSSNTNNNCLIPCCNIVCFTTTNKTANNTLNFNSKNKNSSNNLFISSNDVLNKLKSYEEVKEFFESNFHKISSSDLRLILSKYEKMENSYGGSEREKGLFKIRIIKFIFYFLRKEERDYKTITDCVNFLSLEIIKCEKIMKNFEMKLINSVEKEKQNYLNDLLGLRDDFIQVFIFNVNYMKEISEVLQCCKAFTLIVNHDNFSIYEFWELTLKKLICLNQLHSIEDYSKAIIYSNILNLCIKQCLINCKSTNNRLEWLFDFNKIYNDEFMAYHNNDKIKFLPSKNEYVVKIKSPLNEREKVISLMNLNKYIKCIMEICYADIENNLKLKIIDSNELNSIKEEAKKLKIKEELSQSNIKISEEMEENSMKIFLETIDNLEKESKINIDNKEIDNIVNLLKENLVEIENLKSLEDSIYLESNKEKISVRDDNIIPMIYKLIEELKKLIKE